MVVCSSNDIQPLAVLIIIFVVVLCDCLSLALNGWVYCLVGILIGFVATGYWAGVDQNFITSQFYDSTAATWECNVMPFNPIILLTMLAILIVSILLLFRINKRSF